VSRLISVLPLQVLWSLRATENFCRMLHLPSCLIFNAGNHRPASLTKEIPGGVGILWVYLTILPCLLRLCSLMTCAVSGRVSYFEAEPWNNQYSISDRPHCVGSYRSRQSLLHCWWCLTSNSPTITIRHTWSQVSEIIIHSGVTSLNLCIGSDYAGLYVGVHSPPVQVNVEMFYLSVPWLNCYQLSLFCGLYRVSHSLTNPAFL
jgi:hypothetical protein